MKSLANSVVSFQAKAYLTLLQPWMILGHLQHIQSGLPEAAWQQIVRTAVKQSRTINPFPLPVLVAMNSWKEKRRCLQWLA
jgi:hypothetical protein